MPIEIDGQTYYRTLEVCRKTGISRATLFRWINQGIFPTLLRDRRGWRLFTEDDLNKIKAENGKIEVEKVPRTPKTGKRVYHEIGEPVRKRNTH